MCAQFCLSLCLRPRRLSPVHGILQARSLEWVAISSSRGSPGPRDQTPVSCLLHRQADFWPQGLLGSLQRVIPKAQTRSTGKPGQTAPALRRLPPVSAPPRLCVCTFATEKDRVGLFSFIFVNYLVLPKISYLPVDSLLAECYVLPSNKHAQFRYLFPSVFQTFLYPSASIIMGLREIQRWEKKLQMENLRFFFFLST